MKSSNIKIKNENRITQIPTGINIKVQKVPSLTSSEYHKEELKQNKMIVKNAITMIWFGIALIIASFIVYVFGITETLISGTICGSFIDLFSGTILYLFNKTNENKQNYFNNLSNMEMEKMLLEQIKELTDENTKSEMLKKFINAHINKRYPKSKNY